MTYWVPKLVKYTEKVWTAEVANYETNAAKSQENKVGMKGTKSITSLPPFWIYFYIYFHSAFLKKSR